MRVESLQRSGASAREIVKAHAADVDLIVINEFEHALVRCGHDPAGIALIALGGYGRNELAPNSDLDLLVLYRGWDSPDVTALHREVMYPLWDSGRELGDRIREPRDVIRSFAQIAEVCALLDARLLSGDRGLFADMQGSVWRKLERGRVSYFAELTKATTDRHKRYGGAGHLLEPNIRDSAGGLRDIHTLGWASKVLPGAEGIAGLVAAGNLSRLDGDLIEAAREYLLRLRIELHLGSGRHQDQLYLAEQDDIAARLGYEALAGRPPADRLMQELFGHAREVEAVVSSFWDRTLQAKRRRRFRAAGNENVGDGCVLVDGRLEVVATTNVAEDPAGWLRVLRRSVLRDVPIGRAALNRLHEEVDVAEKIEWTNEARDVFLDILESGPGGVRALEAMDATGLLVALIPEWGPIRAFPQRDLYHRYTVDRHLFAAVAELAASRSSDAHDLRDAWSKVGDPDALFLATLVHDIGKGRGADHSTVGADLIANLGSSIGLSDAQTHDAEFLVRHHLALAETATRRDLNEPRTIAEMAERVTDERRLAMLYLMTRADSLATGPEAWSSFRASLIRELYLRTREFLAGSPLPAGTSSQQLADLTAALGLQHEEATRLIGPMPESWMFGLDQQAARRQLDLLRIPLQAGEVRAAVHHGDETVEFVVVAHDRPGLFSMVAGVLALRTVDVHDAEVFTRSDGIAVEVFRVMGQHLEAGDERWKMLGGEIAAALDGTVDLDDVLAKKAAQTRRRRGSRRRDTSVRVVVDNDASPSHTVVEVHAEDRFGLLRVITKTLADAGCDVSVAKVATYGVQVVDVFYVRDVVGEKITGASAVARLEDRLVSALAPDVLPVASPASPSE